MPIREPSWLASCILLTRCSKKSKEPSDTRGKPGPKRPSKPLRRCSSSTAFLELFQFTPKGGLDSIILKRSPASWTLASVSPSLILLAVLPRSEEHTSELQSRGHLVCR